MTPSLKVGFAGSPSEAFRHAQREVWATLPNSLEPSAAARLLVVDGQADDWVEVAAEATAADIDGLLVVRPVAGRSAADVRELAAVAVQRSVSAVVAATWASHPAIGQLAAVTMSKLGDVSLIDSRITVSDQDAGASTALDHLLLLRAVVGPLGTVSSVVGGSSGYTVLGTCGSSPAVLSGVHSRAAEPRATVDVYAASWEAALSVPSGRTAAPASAFLVDPHGRTQLPTWYETGARASWRRLCEVAAGPATTDDLLSLADDLERAAEISAAL